MKVKKEMLLMDYLLLSYNRKNAKNLLKYKQVYVNNQQISQFDYLLHENDQVEIKKENTSSLEILYEDQEFVVINKPSGLLSMSDGKEKEKTAYHYVSEYLKKQDRKQKVFIVHRLDRETSGVLMFCKNEKIRDLLQKEIMENIEDIKINSQEDGVCHILNVTFYGIKGEVLLHYLEQKGVYVSTGSACSSKKKGSHVLNAIGLSPQEIEGAIRFSLSDLNTEEEIKEAVKIVKESVSDLRMIMRRR